MTKVTVESYQLRVSNASDEAKVYDISCIMNVNDKTVGNIDGGMVMKNGVTVAYFNRWDANNLKPLWNKLEYEKTSATAGK